MINNVDLGSANYGPPATRGPQLQFLQPPQWCINLFNQQSIFYVTANQKTDFKFRMFLTFFNSVGFWKSYEFFALT